MTYCYRCPDCGFAYESQTHIPSSNLPVHCDFPVVRDWKREGVGIGSGVRESKREMTTSGYRDLFLPTAADMAGPDDPDGQKGLREWAETHGPRDDNTKPAWPEMDRKVFTTS